MAADDLAMQKAMASAAMTKLSQNIQILVPEGLINPGRLVQFHQYHFILLFLNKDVIFISFLPAMIPAVQTIEEKPSLLCLGNGLVLTMPQTIH